MDDELFRLCQSVYEATGWDDTDSIVNSSGDRTFSGYLDQRLYKYFVPLYTSDYLLEKLPIHIYLQHHANNTWKASQLQPTELRTAENAYQSINSSGDTPLKSLLKLTLALKAAGELK